MKKSVLMMVGAVALAVAGPASAQTTNIVRITGATAYRSAVHAGVTNMLENLKFGYTGSSFSSAGTAQFIGRLKSDHATWVDLRVSWNGSVDGIQRLTHRSDSSYNVTNWLNNAAALTPSGASGLAAGTENAPADAGLSDCYQNSTLYQTPSLHDDVVGVIPFMWVRNNGCPNTLTNMTPALAQQILASGAVGVPLQFFTGNIADTTRVFVVGRNADSGTRVVAFAESGYGSVNPPNQKRINVSGGNVTTIDIYPAETVLGVPYAAGASGYGSGGTMATALNAAGSTNASVGAYAGWYVGYLGLNDANSVNGGNNKLTWNGVAYSPDAVRNGQYTFWSYEHLFYDESYVTGAKQTIISDLVSQLQNSEPTGSIGLNTMNVTRGTEGGPVSEL